MMLCLKVLRVVRSDVLIGQQFFLVKKDRPRQFSES